MVFGTPACPNCGSRFLVRKIRTGGIFFGHTLEGYALHRCYRCFSKFTPTEEDQPTASVDSSAPTGNEPVTPSPCEIRTVDLELEEVETKYRIESFDLTLENVTSESVTVTRIVLTFDDGEESVAPIEPTHIEPAETASIDVRRSWIHPAQRAVTVDVQSDDESVGTVEIDLEGAR